MDGGEQMIREYFFQKVSSACRGLFIRAAEDEMGEVHSG